MSVITTEVAVGTWEDRADLDYVPCNDKIPGYGFVDALGRKIPAARTSESERRPYKVESGDGVTYIKYDTGSSPIFRVTDDESSHIDPVIATCYFGAIADGQTYAVSMVTDSMLSDLTETDVAGDYAEYTISVTPGSVTAVLVPEGWRVKKDNGFGSYVPFELNNGTTGTGSNGDTLILGLDTFKSYGEFNLVTGTIKIKIEKE